MISSSYVRCGPATWIDQTNEDTNETHLHDVVVLNAVTQYEEVGGHSDDYDDDDEQFLDRLRCDGNGSTI